MSSYIPNLGTLRTSGLEPDGALRIEYPFQAQGDRTTLVLRQDYWQRGERYQPPALDTPINLSLTQRANTYLPPQAAAAIFVGDTPPQPAGAGLVKFTREWATVPINREIPDIVSFERPGFRNTGATSFSDSSTTFSESNGLTVITFGTTSGIAANDVLSMVLDIKGYTVALGSLTQTIAPASLYYKVRVLAKTPTTITARLGTSLNTITNIRAWKAIQREPKTIRTPGIIRYSYVLTNSFESVELGEPFSVTTGLSVETNYIEQTTQPSFGDYNKLIGERGLIPVEATQPRRWKGNIYELKDVMAYAV